jgi:hypothetical protein
MIRRPGVASHPFTPDLAEAADRIRTGTESAAGGDVAWWGLLLVLCLALLAPLTLADVPPLLDYPNHLARLFVLAFVGTDPVLARFYQPHWGIIPNLALDLTVPPLLRVLPVHLVGRAVVGLAILLPVFGAVAYHRALTGRLSYWAFGSVLFAYNAATLRGFLNFSVSVGLALLLGAAWVAWRERRPSLAIATAAVGAVALFFCHLVGLLCFAILVGGHELAALRKNPLTVAWMARRVAVVLAVFAIPVALYSVSDLQGMAGEPEFRLASGKMRAALTPVVNYFWPLDLATAVLSVTVLALCLARRWCVIPLQAASAIIVLLVLFIGLPVAFKGTNDLDTRFIVMAAVLVPAALVPVAVPRRAGWAIGAGFLLLFGARSVVLTIAWNDWAGALAAFRSVIAQVEPGDVVMTVHFDQAIAQDRWTSISPAGRLSDGTGTDSHLPALMLIEHRAWWPFLFDNASQQPIEGRQPYRALAWRIDGSSDPIGLLAQDAPGMRLVTHVLVQGPLPVQGELEMAGLKRIAGDGDTSLFAVRRDGVSGLKSLSTSAPPPPGR